MRWIIVIIFFILITFLFYKAAGTLSLKKLNIVSFCYYNILIFNYIGASLVYLGYQEHYLIKKITSEDVINKTYFTVVYATVSLGIGIIFFNRIASKLKVKERYGAYLKKEIAYKKNEWNTFFILLAASMICILATIYVFYCIGYVPLFKMFQKGFDTSAARVEIARNFSGNIYIRNILVITMTPLLSYAAYIYYRITRKKEWLGLFVSLFALCLLIKTYDFSKSPILYYLFGFYFIEVVLGNVKSLKRLMILGIAFVGIVLVQYSILGTGGIGSYLTIYSGPLGRIFMTQIATLFLHIQAFPIQAPYLQGTSMPTVLAKLAGLDNSWVRSGRIVMELYNRAGIEAGTAGVMNTYFVGEAYANWGWWGVIVSPFVVAIVFSLIFNYMLRSEKSPLNIVIYISLLQTYTTCLEGGFVDFLYNAGVIIMIMGLKGIQILANGGRVRLKKRQSRGYGRNSQKVAEPV